MTTLTTLVDANRLRSSVIRRMFTNTLAEVIGEVLQNAQRAGATRLDFSTATTGFTVQDNGHGIRTVEGFHTLLQIAASAYTDPLVEPNQEPMGVGINALLAHTAVSAVTFTSGGLSLSLETQRWWDDDAYATQWADRMVATPDNHNGLMIAVTCESELVGELLLLFRKEQRYHFNTMAMFINGNQITPKLPPWAVPDHSLIETEYQGNRLVIGFNDRCSHWQGAPSCVNWYGQLIQTHLGGAFSYSLEVLHGRPVNPLAPTRTAIIADAAQAQLHAFITDALFAYLFDPANSDTIKPEWVVAYYKAAPVRAEQDAPYFVARQWPDASPIGVQSSDDMITTQPMVLLRYADQPTMIQPDMRVVHADETSTPCAYGVPSFVPMIGTCYERVVGSRERLTIQTIWWRPGAANLAGFNQPGMWGLGTQTTAPEVWQPVTHAPVYGFNDPNCWDVDEVDFVVGTESVLDFYQDQAWAGFDPTHDLSSYDEIFNAYQESCWAHIRRLIGDCVPHAFTLEHLMWNMPNRDSQIALVQYHYPHEGSGPTAITATNTKGQTKRFTLMG